MSMLEMQSLTRQPDQPETRGSRFQVDTDMSRRVEGVFKRAQPHFSTISVRACRTSCSIPRILSPSIPFPNTHTPHTKGSCSLDTLPCSWSNFRLSLLVSGCHQWIFVMFFLLGFGLQRSCVHYLYAETDQWRCSISDRRQEDLTTVNFWTFSQPSPGFRLPLRILKDHWNYLRGQTRLQSVQVIFNFFSIMDPPGLFLRTNYFSS